ncbi:MAG: transglycosylase domain-containing protein, partial [Candidatus Nanopelagicales bacterium]
MKIDYPREGRRGWRRFVPSWKQTLGGLFAMGLFGVVLGGILFAVAWALVDVPEENDVAAAQTSIVYWNDGKSELARLGDTNRISVPLSKVPEQAQKAVLAAEDRNFYEHGGFAVRGFLRAMWNNLTTGSSQGGSTITQQYAKNAFLTSDKTLLRKFRELVLSLKLESQLTKDEILERYLNTIYYGRGAYGIQTGAEQYFDTDSHKLTLEEAAVLAAILNAPGTFNPENNLDELKGRYAYVMGGMLDEGWITQEEHDEAVAEFPKIVEQKKRQKFAGPNGFLLDSVRRALLAMGYTEGEVEGGGLRVTSTFDRQAQKAAVAAVKEQGPKSGTKGLRIGIAAVEPVTGEVVAMYGGADYLEDSLNNATQAIQQAGSTFKPFGLAAAIESGVGLYTTWPGNTPTYVRNYRVVNYASHSYGERVTLLKGTEQSINTVYVSVEDQIGVSKVRDAALRAGIPKSMVGWAETDDLTFVLGTASPHTLDVAGAYATFASRGLRATPTIIHRISDPKGKVLYARVNKTERVFDQDVADTVNYALQSVVRNGTGSPAQSLGRPAAAKTGSTDEYMSAWFAGYTPQLAAAVSFSKDDEDGNPTSLRGT